MANTRIDAPSTLARAKALILNPGATWKTIAAEDETTTGAIFRSYVLPLALIGPVCGFIGGRLFGTTMYGTLAGDGLVTELVGALVTLALVLISYVILAQIAGGLAPRFGGKVNNLAATQLVAYSFTPVWLVGIFSLWPPLTPLGILSLYSIYLAYRGAGPVLDIPQDKTTGFTVAYVLCGLILNLVVIALSMANVAVIRGMGLVG